MDQGEGRGEDLLATMRPWLWGMARQCRPHDFHTAHDLAQEGWIAAWKALQKAQGDNKLSYARKAARWRMQTCIRDNKWLTSEGYRSVGATDVPTTVNEISDVWEDWEKLTAVEFDVTLAYHEGEIAEAIGDLTPRQQEFVRLRFWEGLSFPELTEYFGYEPNGLLASARKKLRERLRHLKDVT